MSATAETSVVINVASEGLVSNNGEAVPTPFTDLYDDDGFPFEYLDDLSFSDHPLTDDEPDIPVPEDVVEPEEIVQERPREARRRTIPNMYQIINWILGRNITVRGDQRSDRRPAEKTTASKTSSGTEGRENTGEQTHVDDGFIDIGDVQDICPACTTPYCQAIDSLPFKSSLRLGYNDPEKHTWFIGDKYVMTEVVDDERIDQMGETLVMVAEMIRESTPVPVPNVIAGWRENGKAITITERVEGQRLHDIWWHLGDELRDRIARQVASYVDEWRKLTSDKISGLGGGPVWYQDNLFGPSRDGFGPFKSDEKLWEAIERRLRRNKVDEKVIGILRDYMPESAPCVLTHGDLSTTNILIHNGRVSTILGFDKAASLPTWAEHVAVHFCCCKEDEQWKPILSKYMKGYSRSKDWWTLWRAAENSGTSKKRIAALVARCCRWQKPPEKKRDFDPEAPDEERTRDEPSLRDPMLMFGPQLWPPRRNAFQVQDTLVPFRRALSRKLLKGRHYLDQLDSPQWGPAVYSPSEQSEVREEYCVEQGEDQGEDQHVEQHGEYHEDVIPPTEQHVPADEAEAQNQREQAAEEINPVGELDDTHTSIERWLSENERGRKVLHRQISFQRQSGETSSFLAPAREPSWRQRQRSFERGENVSKGLRPLSLAASHMSEGARQKLRGIDETEVDDSNVTREQSIAETLRSLELRQVDDGAGASALESDNEQATQSLSTERKRASIFREKNAPGSLYLTLANAAAEGRSRQPQRSRSEEQASVSGGEGADPRPIRPQSLMPPIKRSESERSTF